MNDDIGPFDDIPKDALPRIWLAKLLDLDPHHIDEQTSMATEPRWDSMAHIHVMLYLEERYGVILNDETIQRYRDFRSIQNLCQQSSHHQSDDINSS